MSHDLTLFKLKRRVASLREFDESLVVPIGDDADVRRAIRSCLSGVMWSGGRGLLKAHGEWFDFVLPAQRPIVYVIVRTSRSGNGLATVVELCERLGWSVFDGQEGDFVDVQAWHTLRDVPTAAELVP